MNEKFEELKEKARVALDGVSSRRELAELKAGFLGKSGEITSLMKMMKDIPNEEKANFGKLVNTLKQSVEEMFNVKDEALKDKEIKEKFEKEAVDVTLPGKTIKTGSLHPLNIVKNEIISALTGMVFEIFEGPEIKPDYNCFKALNIPKDPPARNMKDT
ncbi:MAG: phenylalanine--tRNA ligase subunit alpha, partial [Clostridia bacterium]|nr:phenylalanine--tRNA ligase subunit alpha [Clostridia bacterium]